MGIIVGTSLLFSGEPSVYGAGNIDSSSPYGLTQTEQNVLNNRKQVQRFSNMVSEQQSRIAGLTTVVDGLNSQVIDLKEQLKENQNASSKREEDYKKSYTLLLELGKMIDQINNNYITKDDLSLFQKELERARASQKEELERAIANQQQYEPQVNNNSSNSNNNMIIDDRDYDNSTGGSTNQESLNQPYSTGISEIYREGVQLFSHKSYLSATQKFKEAIAQNYKTAPSNYYLGEIAYYTNDYYSAISYYKKSASLYDKASYMKLLYLHTALSLSKTGQDKQARGFFKYIIDNYPNTKSAEIAQNNI